MAELVWAKKNFRSIVMIATDNKVIWIWMFATDNKVIWICSHWIHLFRITQISRKGHLQRSMVFDNLDDILFTSNGQQLWILFSGNTDGKDSMTATPLLHMHMYFTFLNCYIRWLGRWLNRQPGKTWSTDLFAVHYRSITQAGSDL